MRGCNLHAVYIYGDLDENGGMENMELQMKLASLRKQKGLTQLDLAEKLNVSRQAISRWEVGDAVPSTDNLKILSELYGVSVDFLLNDEMEDCQRREHREPIEQKEESEKKNTRLVWLCAAVLAMAILIMFCIFAVHDKEENQIIPIGDMETVVEDDYSTGAFSIG